MAQVSHSTSQLHIATAFHFLRVNVFSLFFELLLSEEVVSDMINITKTSQCEYYTELLNFTEDATQNKNYILLHQ